MNSSDSTIRKTVLAKLIAVLGPDSVSTSDADRMVYSRDANFASVIRAYYHDHDAFPCAVVWPESEEQIAQIIKIAKDHSLAIVPYGGGSGVCGGTIHKGSLILDTKRMSKILRLDAERLFIEVEAGLSGWKLEKYLQSHGFTLGHFPSSILSASVGGYLAARSAGQCSSRYGKIEDLVIDMRVIDGTGKTIQTSDVSRSRGIDLTQAVVGSEGTLGVITRARLKIFPEPSHRQFLCFRFNSMQDGIEALRRIMQTEIKPSVLRLYDEIDSMLMFAKANPGKKEPSIVPRKYKLFLSTLRTQIAARAPWITGRALETLASGSLLIIVLEGIETLINCERHVIESICKGMNATFQGEALARHWYHNRYTVSFKGSQVFQEGAFTDTMEVATTWDLLEPLYHGVRKALSNQCLTLAHISHVYPEGGAIYFTFLGPLDGLSRSLSRHSKIWDTALTEVQRQGAVLSHHHGIGRLKKTHITQEWERHQ